MITANGKHSIATDYKNTIAKVRLNESIDITDFVTAEVTEDTATIEFDIPNGVTQLQRIRFLDENDQALSDSHLFVPVQVDTRFKYTVRVVN